MLGLGEVLERVLAEVPKGQLAVQLVRDHGARRAGEQDLPAVAQRRDARRPVDAEAVVALVGEPRLADVHPHPDPHDRAVRTREAGQPLLGLDGGRDRIVRAAEDDEERVALRPDLLPAMS